jgi:glycosyltransferase involved in cell wall biosynthesis
MKSKPKLKVWVMTNEFHPEIVGGLGIAATNLTEMLSKAGVEVTVLCSSNSKKRVVSKGKLRIVRVPKDLHHYSYSNRAFKANPVLRAITAESFGRPDLVHVHSTDFATAATAAGTLYRIPVVYTCHSIGSQGTASASKKNQTKLIRTVRRIVVPSKWQASEIKRLYPGTHGKIVVIPHGVTTVAKKTSGSSSRILYVGRLIPSKGVGSLIRAIALISKTHKNVHLTIVGSGSVRYQKHLRTLAKQLGIAERIRWLKHSPYYEVQRMYPNYGAVIVPSKSESFCLVALEAMANNAPLVSTLSGGLKEFVNTNNAQVIQSVNSAAIARAIKEMKKNPAKTKQRLINARATAARYRWPAIARRYKSMFISLRR